MANCGATGTALDRAVAAATSGGGGASKQAVASLVGHASMGNHVASMPMAPPTVLSTTMPTTAMHPSPELHQRPMLLAGFQHYPVANNMRSNLHHYPAALQQHPMAMQQHQLMMMQQQQQQMAMMQQQQQQHMLLMQQQQQQDLQGQENTAHVEDDVETQHASNKKNPTIEDWHEGLEEEAAAHEGRVQGATIEELAAAWAQAEAEYEEYVWNTSDLHVSLSYYCIADTFYSFHPILYELNNKQCCQYGCRLSAGTGCFGSVSV